MTLTHSEVFEKHLGRAGLASLIGGEWFDGGAGEITVEAAAADLMIVLGSSLVVQPAASLPPPLEELAAAFPDLEILELAGRTLGTDHETFTVTVEDRCDTVVRERDIGKITQHRLVRDRLHSQIMV